MRNLIGLIRGQLFLFPRINIGLLRIFGRVKLDGSVGNIAIGRRVVFAGDVTIRASRQCRPEEIVIADHVILEDGVYLGTFGGRIKIGENAFVGVRSVIQGKGGVQIGRNAMLGPSVQVHSADHDFHSASNQYKSLPELVGPVIIGENVWIGAGSIILRNSVVDSHSVVAAGSIVRGQYPERALIGIKDRVATVLREIL